MACPAMVGRQGPCSQATAPGALHLSYHAPNHRRHMRQLRAAGASRCSPLTISEPAARIPHKGLERWIRGVSRDRERASALQPGRRSAERSDTLFRGILRGRRADGQGRGHPGAAIEWSPMLGATPGGTAWRTSAKGRAVETTGGAPAEARPAVAQISGSRHADSGAIQTQIPGHGRKQQVFFAAAAAGVLHCLHFRTGGMLQPFQRGRHAHAAQRRPGSVALCNALGMCSRQRG